MISSEPIDQLDSDSVHRFFPKKYFTTEELHILADDLKRRCDFKNRRGKFINDFPILRLR